MKWVRVAHLENLKIVKNYSTDGQKKKQNRVITVNTLNTHTDGHVDMHIYLYCNEARRIGLKNVTTKLQ